MKADATNSALVHGEKCMVTTLRTRTSEGAELGPNLLTLVPVRRGTGPEVLAILKKQLRGAGTCGWAEGLRAKVGVLQWAHSV